MVSDEFRFWVRKIISRATATHGARASPQLESGADIAISLPEPTRSQGGLELEGCGGLVNGALPWTTDDGLVVYLCFSLLQSYYLLLGASDFPNSKGVVEEQAEAQSRRP